MSTSPSTPELKNPLDSPPFPATIQSPEIVPLSEETLAQIKARAEAATPGIWQIAYDPFMGGFDSEGEPGPDVAFIGPDELDEAVTIAFPLDGDDPYDTSLKANAEFIAHARADIPLLLAEIERLKAVQL